MNAIEITNLKKSFDGRSVLKSVNLTVAKGENLVVLGKSGTGKSVIIKCIVKLIVPDEGEIVVMGQDIGQLADAELRAARKNIGFLFQSGALYDSMSVRENLEFPLRSREKKFTQGEVDELVVDALKSVDLESS